MELLTIDELCLFTPSNRQSGSKKRNKQLNGTSKDLTQFLKRLPKYNLGWLKEGRNGHFKIVHQTLPQHCYLSCSPRNTWRAIRNTKNRIKELWDIKIP